MLNFKKIIVPGICSAAHAVVHETDLSCGESRRDMVFYGAASGVTRGKKKPAPERCQLSMMHSHNSDFTELTTS